MKNFQQNLLIVLALGLCGLCVYQWYAQTVQRTEIQSPNKMVYARAAALQGNTNSMAPRNPQIARRAASLSGLQATVETNEQLLASEKAQVFQLQFDKENLTNEVAQYKTAVDEMT